MFLHYRQIRHRYLREATAPLFAGTLAASLAFTPADVSSATPPPTQAQICAADINRSGLVNMFDLTYLLLDWGTSNERSDVMVSRLVDVFDLSALLSVWGLACTDPVTALSSTSHRVQAASLATGEVATLDGSGDSAEAIGAAADGRIVGNLRLTPSAPPTPVVWQSSTAAAAPFTVAGLEWLSARDVNSHGLAVGAARLISDKSDAAWYRSADGRSGQLDRNGATGAVAYSVNDAGQIGGFVSYDKVTRPVIWDSVTAKPRQLQVPGPGSGGVTALGESGNSAGTLGDDRLALWNASGGLAVPIGDAEAIDVDSAGNVLFGSASHKASRPAVRDTTGVVHALAVLPGSGVDGVIATTLSAAGRVGGSVGATPVVWSDQGQRLIPLTLPAGADRGRVLDLRDDGVAFGWVGTATSRRPAMWRNIDWNVQEPVPTDPTPRQEPEPDLSSVPPAPTTTPTTAPPSPPAGPVIRVRAVARQGKLKVDIDPDRAGKGYWQFTVQRLEADGRWRNTGKPKKTKGSKETRTINLKKGTYRITTMAVAQYGPGTSVAVTLAR